MAEPIRTAEDVVAHGDVPFFPEGRIDCSDRPDDLVLRSFQTDGVWRCPWEAQSASKVLCWKVLLMQQLRVSELMRNCPEAVVSETIRLRDAAELLVTNGFSVLVARNASRQLVGLIPESAVIRELMVTTSRDANVSQILSRHVESVRQDAKIGSILHLFRSSCHEVIPVLDHTEDIVGLLFRHDIVKMLLSDGVEPGTEQTSESTLSSGHKPHFMNRGRLRVKGDQKKPPNSAE